MTNRSCLLALSVSAGLLLLPACSFSVQAGTRSKSPSSRNNHPKPNSGSGKYSGTKPNSGSSSTKPNSGSSSTKSNSGSSSTKSNSGSTTKPNPGDSDTKPNAGDTSDPSETVTDTSDGESSETRPKLERVTAKPARERPWNKATQSSKEEGADNVRPPASSPTKITPK